MLKVITTGNIKYKDQLFRGRKIIGTEETLALIYPLKEKAIFTSGWRSKAEQTQMVAKGASKTMDSNHRRGVAYDIFNWSEMEKEMRKLGFKNEITWDKGHFPLGGEDGARKKYPIIDSLPAKLEEYIPTKTKAKKEPTPIKKIETPQVHTPEPIVPPEVKIEQIKLSDIKEENMASNIPEQTTIWEKIISIILKLLKK